MRHTKLQNQFVELSTAFEQIAKVSIKDEMTRRASQPAYPSTSSSSSSSSSAHPTNQPRSPLQQQQAVIQSENVQQEVLDERNRVCREGERAKERGVGRRGGDGSSYSFFCLLFFSFFFCILLLLVNEYHRK